MSALRLESVVDKGAGERQTERRWKQSKDVTDGCSMRPRGPV